MPGSRCRKPLTNKLAMAGYSGTPLAKKLGIKPGFRISTPGAPKNFRELLEPLPENVVFVEDLDVDLIHFFTKERHELEKELPRFLAAMPSDGMIWVSWPKKAAKVPSDITEDVVRDVALPLGLVDVKVCAIDEVWSGLKLVIRKENRKS